MEQKVEKQASLESVPVKRLKRELKYQGTILKMYEDTVEVNGHQAKWDFIHHDGAAAVLPVTEDGKILMVRQYRNALVSWIRRMRRRLTARTASWRRRRATVVTIWNI